MAMFGALALTAGPAAAQSATSSSVSPSTYSRVGQVLTFTINMNSGGRVVSSVSVTSGIGVAYTCSPANSGGATNFDFTCTGTYVVKATDSSVVESAVVRINSLGVPVDTTVVMVANVTTPTITSVSPNTGSTAGGTVVTISGSGFSDATSVSFGSNPASSFTVNSASSITATAPAGAAGTVDVQVVNAFTFSSPSAADQFTYTSSAVAPTVTQNPANVSVNAGQVATFTAAATGSPTPTVQWQQSTNGGATFTNIAGATSTTLSFTALGSQNGNQFRAVFTNATGSATTTAATLTVSAAPTVTQNPTNQTVNAGGNVSFTAAATGSPAPTVQWQQSTDGGASFTNIAGATSATLSFTALGSQNGNQFRAVFTNSAGSATTTAATLTVNSAPSVTQNPASQTVNAGGNVSFTAAATGSPTPTVQWQQSTDGGATFQNIAGATATTLSFTALGSQNGNQFRAVFTNSAGSATTTAAALTVQTAPVITLQPVDATAAPGQGITVSAAATGNPTPTVAWVFSADNGATFNSLNSAPSFTVVSPTARTILVKGTFTNAAGSATTNTVTLSWVKQDQTISFTSAAPATAVVGGATYAVSATASSGLAVSFAIDPASSSTCSISGATVSFQAAGTCTINANQSGNTTYNAAPQVQQSFTVGQGANVITFPALADTSFTSAPPVPAATASSGLTVTYSSATTSVCTVTSGGSISFVSAGICTIVASQAGNANYVAATPVSQSFNVTPGVNTITFGALPSRALGSGNFTLAATASSGLTVTFSSNTPATCSVSGTTVSLLAVGTCTIAANQAGNGSYQAAPTVTQSFSISKAVTTVSLTSSATTVYFGQPVTLTATVSGVAPTGTVTFSDGATPLGTASLNSGTASFTTSSLASGAHSLTASYSGDASNLASNSSAVAVTVTVRPDPSADPDVRSSVDSQFRTSERFARTQMDNIGGRLDQLHSDGDDRDDLAISLSQPQPRQFNRLPGDSAFATSSGYSYRNNSRPGSPDGLLAAFDPNTALMPQMPGAPMGYAAAASGGSAPGGNALGAAGGPGGRVVHVWASGDVSFGKEQPNGFIETRFTSTGITVGLDGRASDRLKLGVALGFAWDHSRFGINGSNDDATNSSLAFYGSWKVAPRVFLDGIVGMGYGTINTTRWSTTGLLFLDGKRRTSQIFAAMIGTAELHAGRLEVAPYVRVDGIWVHLAPYSETGSPFWALSFLAASEDSFSGSVGTRLRYPLDQDGHWLLTGRAEYRGRLSGDYSQRLGYADLQGSQGTPYLITGQGVTSSSFTGGIGLEARLRTISLRLNYDLSTMAGNNVAQSVSGGVVIKW
ncbi:MAG: autotransporter domain-containing protein [Novosphingobium sp.]